MSSAFARLKNKSDQMDKLAKKIEQDKSGSIDERFWRLAVNKQQVGSATIRFLPATDGEEFPYIKMYKHMFESKKGSTQWYSELCPTTIDRDDCPVCAANSEEWAKGDEASKDIARYRKRNLSYVANIYVIDDPAKPENNGKVFLFEFGARIFQKIEAALKPEFPDMPTFNPFDFWEGANFKLRSRELDGQRSYDMSAFEKAAPLADDETMEKIWGMQHKLLPEIAEDKFKSGTELTSKFNKLYGRATAPAASAPPATTRSFSKPSAPPAEAAPAPAPEPTPPKIAPEDNPEAGSSDAPWEDSPAESSPKSSPAPVSTTSAPATGGSLADKYRNMVKGKK